MKVRKFRPNTYDVNLVKRHHDNSAINTEEVSESGLVGGVACQHFVSDGKALGRDDEGDDNLDAVAALVAGVAEAERRDADAGNLPSLVTWQVFFREERDLLGSLAITGKELHGSSPGRLLDTVEFPQIEDVALQDAPVRDATILDNAPVLVHLAILATFLASQKHDGITLLLDKGAQGGSALQALLESDPSKIKGSSA